MTISSQLVIPLTLWGNQAPTHCISSIYFTRNQKTIVTGCNDGQICLWDVIDNLKIIPRCLLFGHTAPVLCLTYGSNSADSTLLVSSSEAGEMSLWDLTDGRCIETTKMSYVHTNIQAYHLTGAKDVHLFCNGYYAEILVMDVLTLEVIFKLASRISPDWINAIHVLRPVKRQDDVVVALSASGMVKVWTLSGNESKNNEPIYENESKRIKCLNALKLTCCAYNQRTILIVCAKYWQIFDAGDFSLLCSLENRIGERWTGGDFFSADRVLIWSDGGKGYLYKLPTNISLISPQSSMDGDILAGNEQYLSQYPNSIVGNKEFHSPAKIDDQPFLYCILSVQNDERLLCPPAMNYFLTTRGTFQRLLLRGDSSGRVVIWSIPEVTNRDLSLVQQESFDKVPEIHPHTSRSLEEAWNSLKLSPPGILDQMIGSEGQNLKLTSSVYLPLQGRLVCGREDGSIIIVSATQTVMLQLLYGKHHTYEDWPPHQLLHGHTGRVTCLLYPHHLHNRYDIAHLLSGGVDFSVCLWDIYAGTLIHRFCVHAGEITQLLIPPNNCNPRVLQSVCSIASDHSVCLLGLREKKCFMLASRHLFPVQVIKWRPLDDFMVVGCADGSVYVWQMETGHLDRVVQGLLAEEILSACDENVVSAGDRMTNPAIHFFRGLRHRNLDAIRHAAQRGFHQLQHPHHSQQPGVDGTEVAQRTRANPLMIQGLRTNPNDQDSHILFFDIEALIVQLLTEEYSTMSPATLEGQGLINQSEYQKYQNLASSPDAQKKLTGFIAKMKDTAETAAHKIQAKAESVGFKAVSGEVTISGKGSMVNNKNGNISNGPNRKPSHLNMAEANLTMEIAQLLLSILHAWGVDADLDRVSESKLGLLRPMRAVCFGLLSRSGHMALLLPTYVYKLDILETKAAVEQTSEKKKVSILTSEIPPELIEEEERACKFSSRGHWELSTAVTTNHLLAIIALGNTLMSMNSATFVPEQERRRKLLRRLSRAESKAGIMGTEVPNQEAIESGLSSQQAQIKKGWSLLTALHCILLPELVRTPNFKNPQVEILARRWQDRCLEVREAAQALLLAELRRIGPKGRKAVVDEWAPYLPNYGEPYPARTCHGQTAPTTTLTTVSATTETSPNNHAGSNSTEENQQNRKSEEHLSEEEEEEVEVDDQILEESCRKPSSAAEGRRKQATAIVLLGVIGAEYGYEIEQSKRKSAEEQKKKSIVDGFGLSNYSLARHTSTALSFLLLTRPSPYLPAHTSLRRAAIDLIGRGFTVWERHLDVSKILLSLLELCCNSDRLVPSMSYGLPLTPAADSCRTARHALSLIATARPPAFISILAREVTCYNKLAQNPQTLNVPLHKTVLSRARPEILRVIELLIDKMQTDVSDLLVETMDIILHCLDHTQLKTKGLSETFPAICRFNNVSYCASTRRIAVGAKNGHLAIYDLRTSRSQDISAHNAAITACTFSPDGKYLASYSAGENKLCFWQTATGLFGLGTAQTRCVRTHTTTPLGEAAKTNPLKIARLVWVANKMVKLRLLADGTEYKYGVGKPHVI
ncbi:WD repeat-containing protein 7 isoform X4 [Centruroides vittatus]|uniref:WD repeat-containing protein 7 isoform X4 n=1 Tax=Centruroides vittatus TaxID=120091 RepID=UPI00351000C9